MIERRCDCDACRARRLAIFAVSIALLILIGVCIHFVVEPPAGTSGAQIESAR